MTPETKSVQFRRERERTWLELERLVAKFSSGGPKALSASELGRLPLLYRATLSALSVARAISLDRNLVEYLESLSARAWFCVYGPKRRLRDAIADFLLVRFPEAVRAIRREVALSALFLALGALAGFLLTLDDIERFHAFVGEGLAGGRGPTATTERLRAALYHAEEPSDWLATFAAFLFTHNARIGMLVFALGFAAGAPTFLLLLLNGLVLGAFAALYHSRGLGLEFWAWVLPHGVTELGAVALCGGAGLAVAQGLVFPGRHGRIEDLALRGREAGVVVLGCVLLFFVAGLIEGIFRQVVHDVGARWLVALATAAFWASYFARAGRAAGARRAARHGGA